jgi:hypothetical protein
MNRHMPYTVKDVIHNLYLLELDKNAPLTPSILPEFYSRTDRGGPSSMVQSQEVSSLSLGHAYFAARNYSRL